MKSPIEEVYKDYKVGGGQDNNPFEPGTEKHFIYAKEMSRLWNADFKADVAELKAGVQWT